MSPGVFITFDVECSMGGALQDPSMKPVPPARGMMGEYGSRSLGVPLICSILKEFGLQSTFFVEPFNEEIGYPGQTEPVCRFLVEHGQDVQLHIHPNHYVYSQIQKGKSPVLTDQISEFSTDIQRYLIGEGADRIEQWTGERPIAFRAGNMGASEDILPMLYEAGIWMDSSYTFPYIGRQCLFKDRQAYNGCKWHGNVLEVALSGFKQTRLPGIPASQPVDLMGASFEECRDAVRMICDSGGDAVVILHSFSLFKVKDKQYNDGRINRVVCNRFKKFCRWLSEHREEYPARTFRQLGEMIKNQGYDPVNVPPCQLNSPIRSIIRKGVQGVNNFYWV